MEHEFRIREEIIDGRAHGDESSYTDGTADCTGADSSAGSTSCERGVGGDDGLPLHSRVSYRESDRLSENNQRAAGAAPKPDANGRAAEADGDAATDGRTGWEPEREIFLSAQDQTSIFKDDGEQIIALSEEERIEEYQRLISLGYELYTAECWTYQGKDEKKHYTVVVGYFTENGLYTGGSIPYGYQLKKCGRMNKRNREVFDLVIDEDAAKVIQLIFHKYVNEGYGAQRLCRYLTEMNIRKPDGRNFPNTSINRIIKNPIYTGVIRNGDAHSEVIQELQIIDMETFDRAQKLMADRTTHHAETPLNLKGHSMYIVTILWKSNLMYPLRVSKPLPQNVRIREQWSNQRSMSRHKK